MSGRDGALVMALYPFSRGLAFTLFESPLSPIDWGVKDVRWSDGSAYCIEAAKDLMAQHQPDCLVMLGVCRTDGRRAPRIRPLQCAIKNCAEGQAVDVYLYTRRDIRECFKAVGAKTRHEIAQAISARVHGLDLRLPPRRKRWNKEDPRLGLFDAAALVMTFYCRNGAALPRERDWAA